MVKIWPKHAACIVKWIQRIDMSERIYNLLSIITQRDKFYQWPKNVTLLTVWEQIKLKAPPVFALKKFKKLLKLSFHIGLFEVGKKHQIKCIRHSAFKTFIWWVTVHKSAGMPYRCVPSQKKHCCYKYGRHEISFLISSSTFQRNSLLKFLLLKYTKDKNMRSWSISWQSTD